MVNSLAIHNIDNKIAKDKIKQTYDGGIDSSMNTFQLNLKHGNFPSQIPGGNQSMVGPYLGVNLSNANHSFFDKMKDCSLAVDEEVKMDA